ncbi:hypothetical protein J4573_30300 [Actinomadura barringtoniae]|uniref:Uncharacterized protein n=1 Tax=Actinomadura barringtoniae TaxID=1427535 RepID=A0A939T3N4_9ACTN|nr:hypothetical protein [Actinomadura barringtoniae]MBO2451416.1 hypothetical protein [Actinomadura barringtoniae]
MREPAELLPQTTLNGFSARIHRAIQPRRYTSLVGLDIVSFNAPGRDEVVQRELRRRLYAYLCEAFAMTCLPWEVCHAEDRGDGVLIVLPPDTPDYLVVEPLLYHVDAVLRRGNRLYGSAARMRLRMAVHAGHVQYDEYGVVGRAVTHLYRLLDSACLRNAVAESGTELGVIVSHRMFDDVASYRAIMDPARFTPVEVTAKETEAMAWVWLSSAAHCRRAEDKGREANRAVNTGM